MELCAFSKKLSLDPRELNNTPPVLNLPFWKKVFEHAVAFQLQEFLDETDYLDPFYSSIWPNVGT